MSTNKTSIKAMEKTLHAFLENIQFLLPKQTEDVQFLFGSVTNFIAKSYFHFAEV